MSFSHAAQFISSIEGDSALLSRITSTNWDISVVLHEGAARGYSFTSAEFQTALDQQFGVLSEEILMNAAGGKDDGNPSPDPLSQGNSGKWSPPPGNVSGNSCLFGWQG